MTSEKSARRILLLAMLLMAPLLLMGQQSQTTPPQPEESPTEQAEASSGANETPAAPTVGNPQTAAGESQPPPATSKPIKDFKPTDQIGADSAVAFPIDI